MQVTSADDLPNTLAARYPDITIQWHRSKCGTRTPFDVSPGSAVDVEWLCVEKECGYKWTRKVVRRTKAKDKRCPACARKVPSIHYNLCTEYPEVTAQWHPAANGDLRPENFLPRSNKKVAWRCIKGHEWNSIIQARTQGNGCPRCSRKVAIEEYNLEVEYPDIATLWHESKNEGLTPRKVLPKSNKKVWWRCKEHMCKEEWEKRVDYMVTHPVCPSCPKQIPRSWGLLSEEFPDIAKEWDYKANGDLYPEKVSARSHHIIS